MVSTSGYIPALRLPRKRDSSAGRARRQTGRDPGPLYPAIRSRSGLRAALELRGEKFEPPAELIETCRQGGVSRFGGLRPLVRGRRLVARLGKAVGDGQRGHDDKPLVADLAERSAQFAYSVVDHAGERLEPPLFALVAGETVLA